MDEVEENDHLEANEFLQWLPSCSLTLSNSVHTEGRNHGKTCREYVNYCELERKVSEVPPPAFLSLEILVTHTQI